MDEFHRRRWEEIAPSFERGLAAVARRGIDPFPADAFRAECGQASAIARPICLEGIARGYGEAVGARAAKGRPDGGALVRFEARFARLAPTLAAMACRGLGNGLAQSLGKEQVVSLLPQLGRACRDHLVDGYGYELLNRSLPRDFAACERDERAACDRILATSFDGFLDRLCAGLDPDWCAFGAGRATGNSTVGRPVHAVRMCRGRSRAACLRGIEFVSVYLYPDRMGPALELPARARGADQVALIEGAATALEWRRLDGAAQLDRWIEALDPPARALARDILTAARRCRWVNFGDSETCRWPPVRPRRSCTLGLD